MELLWDIAGITAMLMIFGFIVWWKTKPKTDDEDLQDFEKAAGRLLSDLKASNFEIAEADRSVGTTPVELKQLTLALKKLDELAKASKDEDQKRYEKALKKAFKGEVGLAEKLFRTLFESGKSMLANQQASNSSAQKELASIARTLGAFSYISDTPLSLAAYIEAANLDPEDPDVWAMLGAVWLRLGELENAERLLHQALNLKAKLQDGSQAAEAIDSLGSVYAEKADIEKACQYWQKARKLYAEAGDKKKLAVVDELLDKISCH